MPELHCPTACAPIAGSGAPVKASLTVPELTLLQEGLLAEATAFRDANIVDVASYEELKQAIEDGRWARGPWAGQHWSLHTGAPVPCEQHWARILDPLCLQYT